MILAALSLGAYLGLGGFASGLLGLCVAILNSRRGARQTFVDQLEQRIKMCEADREQLSQRVATLTTQVDLLSAREIELMKLLTKTA